MSNNKHIFQMTTQEFVEVLRNELLCVIREKESNEKKLESKEKEFYTRDEAKDLLKISYATLWKYNKDGTLPATKIGSRVYYRKKDIDDAMEGGSYV